MNNDRTSPGRRPDPRRRRTRRPVPRAGLLGAEPELITHHAHNGTEQEPIRRPCRSCGRDPGQPPRRPRPLTDGDLRKRRWRRVRRIAVRRRRAVLRRPRGRVPDHVPRRRRPFAGDGRAGAGPGRDLPLQRRHRDGQGRAHRRQPADPGAEPDPGRREEGRDRDRGRVVRDQLGLRRRRHPAGGVQPGHRRVRRRVDDFAAVHQELLRRRRPDADAQVGRAREVVQDEPDLREGGHHHRLPQHHLLRPRRLRDPGRRAGLLRQGRRAARLLAVRAAGRADPAAGPLGEHRRRRRAGGTPRWTGC